MPSIAAVGDVNSVLAFRALGATAFEIKTEAQAQEALKEVVSKQFDLVFITENLQPGLQRILDDNPSLVYLLIPPIREAPGTAKTIFEEIVKKTVGLKH